MFNFLNKHSCAWPSRNLWALWFNLSESLPSLQVSQWLTQGFCLKRTVTQKHKWLPGDYDISVWKVVSMKVIWISRFTSGRPLGQKLRERRSAGMSSLLSYIKKMLPSCVKDNVWHREADVLFSNQTGPHWFRDVTVVFDAVLLLSPTALLE